MEHNHTWGGVLSLLAGISLAALGLGAAFFIGSL